VLWASLVDDPSSWPDRFPTEADQAKERQRLFDILGRFETETDKKGTSKQVVRGLVSWDDIKEPEVINEAQREIARCLAWERGEEPPTKPDAVRDYIAQYAPPAYDPFAGGGSIPLEAQRLGLEAHASDLNPVAVLINKALIEIPPRFRDQAPVNPRDNRGQGIGNRGQESERGSVPSGSDCLAEGHGSSGAGLSSDRSPTEGGNVSSNQSDHKGGGFGAGKYSGGERTGDSQGLRPFFGDRQGIVDGNRDVSDVNRPSELSDSTGRGSNSGVDRGNQQDVNFPSQKASSTLNSPVTSSLFLLPYKGAQGLAADVRYYGEWMREEAFKRIGHLYPKVVVGNREVGNREVGNREEGIGNSKNPVTSSLSPVTSSVPSSLSSIPSSVPSSLSSTPLTVIAWLWARTVTCPNPACGCRMPLVRSFQLSTKKGKEAWVEPVVVGKREEGVGNSDNSVTSSLSPVTSSIPSSLSSIPSSLSSVPSIRFEVKTGKGTAPEGTVERKGAVCLACESPVPLDHVRSEGKAGRMGQQLMAIVAEGQGGRVYLSPTEEQEEIALSAQPSWKPETKLPEKALGFRVQNYGMTEHAHLFTDRQLVALTTFSDLVTEAKEKAIQDAVAASLPDDDRPLCEGGAGARAYAEAISIYLSFVLDRMLCQSSTLCYWSSHAAHQLVVNMFARQALAMSWDFGEINPFCDASSWEKCLDPIPKSIESLPAVNTNKSNVYQADATTTNSNLNQHKFLVSCDPPYYDNIGYSDLSDFFYAWLRNSVSIVYPSLFTTMVTPKSSELIATPFRFNGNKEKAKNFFESGLKKVFSNVLNISKFDYPFTIFYAFKQAEVDTTNFDLSVSSTGWETMLEGLIQAQFTIIGTWPVKTERPTGVKAQVNALASSIVLVCRPRPADAKKTSRRQFIKELEQQLPKALKTLQQGNIAPVDLAQASIGPGMAIYSQYAAVLENDGSPLTVRTALQLINQQLDQFLEGEFDSDTRWALTWFEQYQFNAGSYGDAETLSKAKNTSVQGLVNAGILEAKAGKVRLLPREEIGQKKGNRKEGIGKREEGIGNSENPVTSSLSSIPSSVPSSLSSVPSPVPSSLSSIPSNAPHWFLTQVLIHTLDKKGETGAADLLAKLGDRAEIAKDLAYRLYNLCDRKGWTQEAISYNSLVISWPEISRLANEYQPAPEQMSFL
jgi:putative DNA methylase